MKRPLRIAYVVSRFPATSETFVVREMNQVAANADIEVELLSLFPAGDRSVHAGTERWTAVMRRPSGVAALTATLRWFGRRPLTTLGMICTLVARSASKPKVLVKSLTAMAIAAALSEDVRDRRVDHVHAHFASYPTLAAWVCFRLTGIPYSFTAHAYDIFVDRSMLCAELAAARFVCTISEYNRGFIRDHCPAATTPIEVVHMGVDPDDYEFRPRTPPAAGAIRCLCVATLQEKKGHAVLLRALASRPELDRVHLDLAGGGELRGPLESLARELGIIERIDFHGAVPESGVKAMLATTDLFALPSVVARDGQMEGLPVALIEALAAGVPTVASRMSGIPELIEDGVTGYLAEPGDVDDLATVLGRAISGEKLDLDRGRRLVESRFDVRESGVRMADLFRSTPHS